MGLNRCPCLFIRCSRFLHSLNSRSVQDRDENSLFIAEIEKDFSYFKWYSQCTVWILTVLSGSQSYSRDPSRTPGILRILGIGFVLSGIPNPKNPLFPPCDTPSIIRLKHRGEISNLIFRYVILFEKQANRSPAQFRSYQMMIEISLDRNAS